MPYALKDKVKAELDNMERNGVIIKEDHPTEWVNSMVVVTKPNGKLRICMDPNDLNKSIMREHFPLKTIEEITAEIEEATMFTKLDATNGFWQVKLDEPSSKLCTFNTPFGRYRFLRLPFGINSASEIFQRTTSEMVQSIAGAENVIDDILVWGRNREEHDRRLKQVLEKAQEYNLKLSPGKCEFRKPEVTFVGHRLTKEGVKPDPEKVRAVKEMKQPTTVKELQTFLGFVTYLGKFIPNMSTITAPLRTLLEKDTAWHWNAEQESSFQELKSIASSEPVLQYYNAKKPVKLSVDASSTGLGAVLLQDDKPVAYASRALTETQQRYAQIEKETLAILYGCTKFHEFVYGKDIQIETDHKPLQAIFNKPLWQSPARLQKLRLALQRYNLHVNYKPGKEMYIADHLSRSYLNETVENLVPDLQINEVHLIAHLPVSDVMYKQIQTETAKDADLTELMETVLNGWPNNKDDLPSSARPYWTFRDELSCIDGILYKSEKIVIPKSLRKKMLAVIHEPHLGIVKSINRARDVLFWLGMTADIEQTVRACTICAATQNANPKEPMLIPDIPNRPWSKLAADLFEFRGIHYLLVVDYFSKWPEVLKLDNLSSSNTVSYMKGLFSRYGIPDEVVSDNGPQFSSGHFKSFAEDYNFKHTTSSPHFAQSNGQAERAVQTVKNLIRKSEDPSKALLAYRNTPLSNEIDLSPAQIFLGRRLKTNLPTAESLLKPHPYSADEIHNRLRTRQLRSKVNYDTKGTRKLDQLRNNEKVMFQTGDTWTRGTIIQKHHTPRSYVVSNFHGTKFRRNRKHIRRTQSDEPTNPCAQDESTEEEEEPRNSCVQTRSGRISKTTRFSDYVH